MANSGGLFSYYFVRGGSFQVNNWEYVPDYALAERILKKNYELCPALAGPNGKSWKDSKLIRLSTYLYSSINGVTDIKLVRNFKSRSSLITSGLDQVEKEDAVWT